MAAASSRSPVGRAARGSGSRSERWSRSRRTRSLPRRPRGRHADRVPPLAGARPERVIDGRGHRARAVVGPPTAAPITPTLVAGLATFGGRSATGPSRPSNARPSRSSPPSARRRSRPPSPPRALHQRFSLRWLGRDAVDRGVRPSPSGDATGCALHAPPRLPLAVLVVTAAALAAGCNGPIPADLFLVQRTGSIPGAKLTLRLTDDGGAYCNETSAGRSPPRS